MKFKGKFKWAIFKVENKMTVSGLQCSLPYNENLSGHSHASWCSQHLKKSLTLEGHPNRSNEGHTKLKR